MDEPLINAKDDDLPKSTRMNVVCPLFPRPNVRTRPLIPPQLLRIDTQGARVASLHASRMLAAPSKRRTMSKTAFLLIALLVVLLPLAVLAEDPAAQTGAAPAAAQAPAPAPAPAPAAVANATAAVAPAPAAANSTEAVAPEAQPANATAAGNATQAEARRRRRRVKKPIHKVSQLVAKIQPSRPRARPPTVNATVQTKKEAPEIPPTLAEAEIEFYLRTPNSVIGDDKALFEQRIIQEISKGVNQPARRFEILSVTPGHKPGVGPMIRFRIQRVTPRDDPRSLSAQQVATTFYDHAMDPANVWVNLPLLSHVDRTRAIVVEVKKWKPRPKEPTIHAQMRIEVDIRKIEPKLEAFLRAFEVDVAAGVGCEPEQIEVTGAEPDEDGLSLTSLIVYFDIHPRLRELPEPEMTPTNIVNTLKKLLLDPKSPLRIRPTMVRADPFFPLQNIIPKAKANPDWVRDPEQYQVAEIAADPIQLARPYILPTLYVQAPPAPVAPAPIIVPVA